MKRFFLLLIILNVFFPVLKSQFYSTGEDPASIKWYNIETNHFKLVFPENITPSANHLAHLLEFYYPYTIGDLHSRVKKRIPVLLHQYSVNSNGYVTLAPRRMELVTTPPRQTYSQDWLSQLALHETRHVVQLSTLNRGFTYGLSLLTGQIGRGLVSAELPSWFYEGDAVYNETRNSNTGRGRSPEFVMPLKALLMERDHIYSYDKSLFGSYRDLVPDQYVYGYHMINYGRTVESDSIWRDVLHFTGNHSFLIWPAAIRLKSKYGYFNRGLYVRAMASFKNQIINETAPVNSTYYKSINNRAKRPYAHYIGGGIFNGHVISFRSGAGDPGSFISIDEKGREKRLITTGTSMVYKYDIQGKLLVWDEVQYDPRWSQRSYSVIRSLDLATLSSRYITKKSRFFSPDVSPDGTRIVVSENDVNNNNFITVIKAENGKILQRIPAYDRSILTPQWSGYSEIIYITVTGEGKQLESVNLSTQERTVIIPATTADISMPLNYGRFILFSASLTGTDNIFAINKATRELYRVTGSEFGAMYPSLSADKKNLLFSNYSSEGYNITMIPNDTATWVKTDPSLLHAVRYPGVPQYADSLKESVYEVKRFKRGLNLINLHSWLPFYTDVEEIRSNPFQSKIYPGLMLFSHNLLSTFISTISYHYENGYHYLHPSVSWRGWYPVFELSADVGGPQKWLGKPESFPVKHSWPYAELNLKTYIPLHYTYGNSHLFVTPMVEFEHSSVSYLADSASGRGINFAHLRFNVSHFSRMSARDLFPRYGQTLALSYSNGIFAGQQFGSLVSVEAMFFFPGILKHHHLIFQGGYQLQDPGKYYIPVSRVDFPRGYRTAVSREISSLKMDYSFPLLYPDLSLGPVLYVKRIRADLFYDLSYGTDIRMRSGNKTSGFTGYLTSYGGELLADFHSFRIIFPVTAGVRVGYIPSQKDLFAEFVINIETGKF